MKNNKTLLIFLFRALLIYVGWSFFYYLFLYWNRSFDDVIISQMITTSRLLLEKFGFNLFRGHRLLGISGTSGLIISPECDGLSLFVLFAGFVVALPGNVKWKFLFISMGLLIIDLLNILRIIILVLIEKYSPQSLEFNHSYTFTLLIYTIVFGMWIIWIRYFRVIESKKLT